MNQASDNDQVLRDVLARLEAQARGMWRYRWRAVIVAWAIAVIGWFTVYSMPNVYEANARIYVDTENAIRPLLQGIATSSNLLNEVTVVTREMLSRPNLAEVARDTDLDLRAQSDKQFQALLDSLQKRIRVTGNRENIFSIAYQDSDRNKAIAVVDSLVNTFVEKSLGADRTDSTRAQTFLREQIARYERRLTEAEDRLATFKRDNVAVMPGQQGDYFSRLQAARATLDASQSRLRLAQERRTELMRQLEGEEPVFGIMQTGPAQQGGSGFTGAKIRELELQLEELRLQYTDKHPRIGQILDTLELLKKQQAEEVQAAQQSGGRLAGASNPLEQNPVYQNMRIQLTNTEVEIASLRAEVGQQTAEIAELRRLVDTVPQVEAELNRLNRDYDVVKGKHDQLLQQLESANIGENVDASIDEVQFRIIDPPFSALQPAGPKRQLFMAGVLIVALGAGGALTLLLNLLHPVFFYSRTVTTATGLPVLGSVNLTLSPAEERVKRASRYRFAVALGLLFVSFMLVSVFAEQWSPAVRVLASLAS
jgi:polysaccharide chain length determinant protein (PEP-CTERM system associated)